MQNRMLLVLSVWLLAVCAVMAKEPDAALLPSIEEARQARVKSPTDAYLAFRLGELLLRAGSTEAALAELAEARKLDPNAPAAYLLPALVLRDSQQPAQAVALLEEARARGVRSPDLQEQLAFLWLAAGHKQQAAELAAETLAAHPDRVGSVLVRGLALAEEPSHREEAARLLGQALQSGVPDPGRVRLVLGSVLLELGRPAEAVVDLREAARLLPDLPEAHYKLGSALRAAGDLEGATAELKLFQKQSQDRDAAEWQAKEQATALNQAQALAQSNRLPEALEAVTPLVQSTSPAIQERALSLRAKVLFSMGRAPEALADITRARELRPQLPENHHLQGLFLYKLNRLTEAEAFLRSALALDPALAETHELLGRVLADQNRHPEAVAEFREAAKRGLDTPALQANLQASLEQSRP